MRVEVICVSPGKGGEMMPVNEVRIVAGKGIVGDRHFSRQGYAGQNLTLIEAEEIEAFNSRTGMRLSLTDPRRSIVTRGVRLNDLLGRDFSIGPVRVKGVELCEPCGKLARYLAASGMTQKEFVRQFAGRCGLRADVVSDGVIRVGDAVQPGH